MDQTREVRSAWHLHYAQSVLIQTKCSSEYIRGYRGGIVCVGTHHTQRAVSVNHEEGEVGRCCIPWHAGITCTSAAIRVFSRADPFGTRSCETPRMCIISVGIPGFLVLKPFAIFSPINKWRRKGEFFFSFFFPHSWYVVYVIDQKWIVPWLFIFFYIFFFFFLLEVIDKRRKDRSWCSVIIYAYARNITEAYIHTLYVSVCETLSQVLYCLRIIIRFFCLP